MTAKKDARDATSANGARMDGIMSRRSVRKFTAEPVPVEKLEAILTAAMNAPSAGNEQAWEFIVIKDRATLEQIPKFSPFARCAAGAQLAILVCGNMDRDKYGGFWVQDCSAATQNILLEASAQGLGAVWTGAYPAQDRVDGYSKLFNLPSKIVPFALVPIGYPAESPKVEDRTDNAKIHVDKW
jgi:nitroreductase